MFPARNISIGARADRRHARLGMIERRCFQRAEGWIARRGDFFLPAFVCFFGAFFSQEKKAEFQKRKKAQEITLQIRRFAGEGQCRGRGLPRRSALAMTDTGNANRRGNGPHPPHFVRHLPQRGRRADADSDQFFLDTARFAR